ncbi:hypothetical protein J6590_071281 [Homalodisca vitripennis]|nr:hypothetical protein J6590_071281 [Homalodisca vitripennis]
MRYYKYDAAPLHVKTQGESRSLIDTFQEKTLRVAEECVCKRKEIVEYGSARVENQHPKLKILGSAPSEAQVPGTESVESCCGHNGINLRVAGLTAPRCRLQQNLASRADTSQTFMGI